MKSKARISLLAGIAALTSMVATACSDQAAEGVGHQTYDTERKMGIPPPWGDEANKPVPTSGRMQGFNPKHFSVVYMRLGADGLPEAIHETHKIPASGVDGAVACVLEEIRDNVSRRTCAPPEHPTFPNRPNNQRNGFIDFDFTAQQYIYFYVEGSNTGFNRDYPISFTPYGPFDGTIQGNMRSENYSFYNGKVIDTIKDFPGVLYLENHFRSADGTGNPPKNPKDNLYSMNLHLLVCKSNETRCDAKAGPKTKSERSKFIPIIVDPDTGNGTGNGPPP